MTFIHLLEMGVVNFPQDDLVFKITRTDIFPIVGIDRTTNPKILGTFLPLFFQNSFAQARLHVPNSDSIVLGSRTDIVSITGKTDATDHILMALQQKNRFSGLQVVEFNILNA